MGGGTDDRVNAKVEASQNLRLAESGAKKCATFNEAIVKINIFF